MEKEASPAAALELLSSPELLALVAQLQRSAPALTQLIARLEALQADGALDGLLALVDLLAVAQASLTDGMVVRLADKVRVAAELIDPLVDSGLSRRLPGLLAAVQAAGTEAIANPRPLGLLALLAALREPGAQVALKFLLALTRQLPAATGK